MNIYTSNEYFKENPDWHWEDAPYKAREIAKVLDECEVSFSSAVDVGCGVGRVISILAKKYPVSRFKGYDISPGAIEIANREFRSGNVEYFCADFFSESGAFDLVLCLDVIEHVPDYIGFLGRLRKKGNLFVFHVPLEMNALHILSNRNIHKKRVGGHLHFFSRATFLSALADAGYEVVRDKYTFGSIFQPHSFKSFPKLMLKIPRILVALFSPVLMERVFGGASLLVVAKTKAAENE